MLRRCSDALKLVLEPWTLDKNFSSLGLVFNGGIIGVNDPQRTLDTCRCLKRPHNRNPVSDTFIYHVMHAKPR